MKCQVMVSIFCGIQLYIKTFTQMFHFHTLIEAFLIEKKRNLNFLKIGIFYIFVRHFHMSERKSCLKQEEDISR